MAEVAYLPMQEHPSDGQEPLPPPTDAEAASARGGRGEAVNDGPPAASGGRPAVRKREKRKPTPNVGNVATLYRDFAYEYGTELAWDRVRLRPIKISHLRHTFGHDAVKIWMNSEKRAMVFSENIVFEPGVELGPDSINLFGGLPVEPVPGDCTVMLELLRHLCSMSSAPGLGPEEVADWVLRWCALPLQQLGAKMDTALVFHGPQGTGKNLFFDVLRDLYGEYGVMVGQTEIEDKYNTWLSRRMLIIGDEVVSRQEMYHAKNRLKWIVTQSTKIPIRAMHQDTRWESNHANLVFLSNESQPLALEDGDRRYCVIYTPTAQRSDLYARVRQFLDSGGAAVFLHFLLNLDLGDFTPHTKPPMTSAKQSLIELGMKPAQRFMHEWISGFLPLPMRPCSAEQLYRAFRRWADHNGERFPPKQAEFTEECKRFTIERVDLDEKGNAKDPLLRYKVVQLRALASESGGRKACRCWLPRGTGPLNGVSEGIWVAEAVEEFERYVDGFLRKAGEGDAA